MITYRRRLSLKERKTTSRTNQLYISHADFIFFLKTDSEAEKWDFIETFDQANNQRERGDVWRKKVGAESRSREAAVVMMMCCQTDL